METVKGAVTGNRLGPPDPERYERRFASRAAGIRSSAMRDMMSLTERPDIISLATGFPDTASFPAEVFDDVWAAIARDHRASSLQYGPTEGLAELRERICEIMAYGGAEAHPDDIIVTAGGQQAIDLSVRTFTNPGDVVLAEGPTYPGAVPSLTTYEARVVHVPIDEDGMLVDQAEAEIDRLTAEGTPPKLIYTIPTFHNPGGVTMSLERRRRLIELARERELLIIEDNPYGYVRFEGDPLPTLWELDGGEGWVLHLSTFSKILAPGLRVGWVAAPGQVLRKMNLSKQAADLGTATMTQRFVVEYLKRTDWREHVQRLNTIYRGRRDALLGALDAEFPAEASWTRPAGGLFVWATLPDYIDTAELLARAIERQKVAFVPGEAAFLDGRGRHSMRLNFSGAPEDVLVEGVQRIGQAIEQTMELRRALGGSE